MMNFNRMNDKWQLKQYVSIVPVRVNGIIVVMWHVQLSPALSSPGQNLLTAEEVRSWDCAAWWECCIVNLIIILLWRNIREWRRYTWSAGQLQCGDQSDVGINNEDQQLIHHTLQIPTHTADTNTHTLQIPTTHIADTNTLKIHCRTTHTADANTHCRY